MTRKYDLSKIMKKAWELVKTVGYTISSGLKKAWEEAKTMKEYLICEEGLISGVRLAKARHYTDDEKANLTKFVDKDEFVITSSGMQLKYLTWNDLREYLGNRRTDGYTNTGGGNIAFIITIAEWNGLLELNECKKLEQERAQRMKKIEEYEDVIKKCEEQGVLFTIEEARQKCINYSNLYNEGRGGYVPHFYTIDEYEYAKIRLSELNK